CERQRERGDEQRTKERRKGSLRARQIGKRKAQAPPKERSDGDDDEKSGREELVALAGELERDLVLPRVMQDHGDGGGDERQREREAEDEARAPHTVSLRW